MELPIVGVTVQEKGSKTGTATDASGNFSLSVTKPNASVSNIIIGYETQTIALAGRSSIDVTLTGCCCKRTGAGCGDWLRNS